jgi:hypothetical protein
MRRGERERAGGYETYEEAGVRLKDGTTSEHEPEIGLLSLELRRDQLVQPTGVDLKAKPEQNVSSCVRR